MEADQQVQDFLFDLPPELTDLIYSTFLSESKWRFLMRRVCKRWMNFINITNFKLGLVFGPEVKEIADSFAMYTTQFGLNFSKATIHTIRTDQYAPLTKLSNLTSLTIAHQKLTDGRDPTFISALTNLEHLDVHSISDTTLNPLKHLTSLSAVVYTIIDHYADEPPSNNPIHLNLPFLESAAFTPVQTREWVSSGPSEVPPLLSYGSRLTKLTINKFVDMTKNYLDQFSNLKQLEINAEAKSYNTYYTYTYSMLITLHQPKLPNLESLITNTEVRFLPSMPLLTYLEINSFPNVQITHKQADYYEVQFLTNLRALKLSEIYQIHEDLDFSKLTQLSSLTLRRRHIISLDKILQTIKDSQLKALKLIDLHPQQSLVPISKFSKLIDLDLSFATQETDMRSSIDFAPIMALTHLTRLRICANHVQVTINGISKLGSSLRSLSITNLDNHVEGLDEIKFLKHLTHLDAVVIKAIDLSGLTSLQLANIKNITVNENEDTYSHLTSLSITSALPDWSYLTRMTSLESFELRVVAFRPEDIIYFTALKKLKYLILSGSQWHDNYTTLSQLHTLRLTGVSSIPYDPEQMRKKIPLYTEYIMPTPNN